MIALANKASLYTSSIILFYTYIGYGIIVKLCTFFIKKTILIPQKDTILPEITHIIACFNEEKIIHKKIENSISLNYPNEKLKTIFVTDGSTDKSMKILSSFPSVINYHTNERKGKLDAINRVIEDIQTEIIVFSDANSFLNKMALRNISIHFQDVSIGAVAGEKKVLSDDKDDAAAAGEGLYWKYESWLKKMDYHLFSVVGAAGELFAIRAKLYQKPNANLLIEDHGIYIQPVFYPTVPKGDERFRVTITPKHQAEDIERFLSSLNKVWDKLSLRREVTTIPFVKQVSKIY